MRLCIRYITCSYPITRGGKMLQSRAQISNAQISNAQISNAHVVFLVLRAPVLRRLCSPVGHKSRTHRISQIGKIINSNVHKSRTHRSNSHRLPEFALSLHSSSSRAPTHVHTSHCPPKAIAIVIVNRGPLINTPTVHRSPFLCSVLCYLALEYANICACLLCTCKC